MTTPIVPILLFNDECAVCRRIGSWVLRSARGAATGPTILARPIGDDPDELDVLSPGLDIWDAYAVVHVLMPDGTTKVGGAAVAEVLRRLPSCRWFAWAFSVKILGFAPFQSLLDLGYAILSHLRPLLGCESCGAPPPWLRFLRGAVGIFRRNRVAGPGGSRSSHPSATVRSGVTRSPARQIVVTPAAV